jgi:putative transposase
MIRAYKYRLNPNNYQKELLDKHIGCCRFVYNLALECKQMAYLGSKKNLWAYDLINQLPDLKKELTWLKEVDSQILQQSLFDLDKAFTRFFKGISDYPKFKSKKQSRQSFRSPHPKNIRIIDDRVWLPKFRSGIKIIQERPIKGTIKSATVSRTSTGKYFISILCETGVPIPDKSAIQKETSVGVDLGIKHFIVTSDGQEINNPKFLKNSSARLKVLQQKLRNKKNGSTNQKKAFKKIALLHEKVANQRKDFLHKLSTQLIRENQTICCEDLNIKGMVKNHKLARSISDAGWGMFVDMLKYKAEWSGVNLLQIPTFEASTKVCHVCGVQNHTLTLKDRKWMCAGCGTFHHRDINAARVIQSYCLRKSGQALPGEPVELPTLVGVLKQENTINAD